MKKIIWCFIYLSVVLFAKVDKCDLYAGDKFDKKSAGKIVYVNKIQYRKALKACESSVKNNPKNMKYVYQLGRVYHKKELYDKAEEQYLKACHGEYIPACNAVGSMYGWRGDGGKLDIDKALKYHQKACCSGSYDRGCHSLGYFYENGQGVDKDIDIGAALYTKGCKAGFKVGCGYLSNIYSENSLNKLTKKEVKELYQEACSKAIKQDVKDYMRYENEKINNNFKSDKKVIRKVNNLIDSFVVDGLKSGMKLKDVLPLKWSKNSNGSYKVMTGHTNMMTELLYGKDLKGEFLSYETEILSKKVNVSLWFTEQSKSLYGIRVKWDELSSLEINAKLREILNKKYGKSYEGEKGNATLDREIWEPNNHIKIILSTTLGDGGLSFSVYIDYIDTKLQKEDKVSSKIISEEDMNKL